MVRQSTESLIGFQQLVQANITESIKNHYWSFGRRTTGHWWISSQRASDVENVSMSQRHDGIQCIQRRRNAHCWWYGCYKNRERPSNICTRFRKSSWSNPEECGFQPMLWVVVRSFKSYFDTDDLVVSYWTATEDWITFYYRKLDVI